MAHRKLFLAHAGELVHLLVRTLGPTGGAPGVVSQFARSYAQRFNRPGLLSNPVRVFELQHTITREALLVAAVELRRRLPQAFARSRGDRVGPEEAAMADAFFGEFVDSMGRSLDWQPLDQDEERESLRRDLELYQHWTRRGSSRSDSNCRPALAQRDINFESPFPDRCALLLDPAMMEQARRAAAEFEKEILATTARIFAQLGVQPSHAARPRRQKKPRRVAAPRSAVRNDAKRARANHARRTTPRGTAKSQGSRRRKAVRSRKPASKARTIRRSKTAPKPRISSRAVRRHEPKHNKPRGGRGARHPKSHRRR